MKMKITIYSGRIKLIVNIKAFIHLTIEIQKDYIVKLMYENIIRKIYILALYFLYGKNTFKMWR